MHLTPCGSKKSTALEEYYTDVSQTEHPRLRKGTAMLDLIARLRALPDERQVYGLISHYQLRLLAEDTCESPCFVTVDAWAEGEYVVQYLMPEEIAPWPRAYVQGRAHSAEEAVRMILTAMERSRGWS